MHTVKPLTIPVEDEENCLKEVPHNMQLALIRIEKNDDCSFYKSVSFLYRHRWQAREHWLHFEAPFSSGEIKKSEIIVDRLDNLFGLKLFNQACSVEDINDAEPD